MALTPIGICILRARLMIALLHLILTGCMPLKFVLPCSFSLCLVFCVLFFPLTLLAFRKDHSSSVITPDCALLPVELQVSPDPTQSSVRTRTSKSPAPTPLSQPRPFPLRFVFVYTHTHTHIICVPRSVLLNPGRSPLLFNPVIVVGVFLLLLF